MPPGSFDRLTLRLFPPRRTVRAPEGTAKPLPRGPRIGPSVLVPVTILAIGVVVAGIASAGSPGGGSTLTAHGGRPYAADSVWNSPIPDQPEIDPDSAAIVARLSGSAVANLDRFGTPVYTVTEQVAGVPVTCTEQWGDCEVEHTLVPIPPGARPSSGSDGSMSVVDLPTRRVFDFWQLREGADASWTASWATVSDLDGSGLDPIGTTAAGFSVLAGLIRTFEIEDGVIDHALVFSSDSACREVFRYPATRTDGQIAASNCVPEGTRVQLDPSIDVAAIPGITPGEQAVARALQTYGAYCRDRGGAPMAINFEARAEIPDSYLAAGFKGDYDSMSHIPWERLRVLRSWDGS